MEGMKKNQELASAYRYEADCVSEQEWCALLDRFDDANIYQTWSHAAVISGGRNLSHVVVKKDDEVIAIVQARVAKVPWLRVGIAYIRWGPLWRRTGEETTTAHFRQALRAIRKEYVQNRGLVLRIFPIVIDDADASFSAILQEEGFSARRESRGRTILMDLSPDLDELREGMRAHWKRELKVAEKSKCEIVEGPNDELFGEFITIYKEMVSRKKFVEPNDIHQFREIQSRLPAKLKMTVMLAKSNGAICAGLICSAIGDTAVYLFGATSNTGTKSRGSYLLHWKLLDELKQGNVKTYNLNGINPINNPGTYKFKNDLAGDNGKDVYYAGRFEAHAGSLSRWAVDLADRARAGVARAKAFRKVNVKQQGSALPTTREASPSGQDSSRTRGFPRTASSTLRIRAHEREAKG
jgi:lipid II:glycine glycyltransferase (peptidoglycan interpeptide bridge formation enzyme)